ncbi:MAG: hypothetical protein ACI4FZ_08300 [Lachnospiraceae bacterium]
MDNTVLTCITQVLTTILTIGASILIAYLTYKSQKLKSNQEVKRLQNINRDAALELFRAYLANLAYFITVNPILLDKNDAIFHCRKLELVEKHLSDLTAADLPDAFIKDFQFFRLKIALFRLSLESEIEKVSNASFSSELLSTLKADSLSQDIKQFISTYQKSS